ncbi:MAG: transglycosylase domain-containing protein, partial [Xanthobacteraceae bacterium]
MRHVVLAMALGCVALVAASVWWIVSLGPAPVGKDLEFSREVLDRNGRLLRAYATSDGRWRLPATTADVDPRFFDVLFTYEDKRFRVHHGVDALALARAALQLIESGRIRSGGSTLTMQVARLLEPRSARTFAAKFRQIVRAIEIERASTKDEVLSLYLELAPFGGNIEGIRAASLVYFGKEPRHLTLAEAALLVALPQSPELRRPDRFPEAARAARNRVLDRFAATGVIA